MPRADRRDGMRNLLRSSKCVALVVSALVLATCTTGPAVSSGTDPMASASTLSRLPPNVGPSDCSPASPTTPVRANTQVAGQDGAGSAFWALFPGHEPFSSATNLHVRLAVNGAHGMRIILGGPGGQEIRLDHVYPDFGAGWGAPGDIWAAKMTFPAPGCWRISADRADKHADFWVLVK